MAVLARYIQTGALSAGVKVAVVLINIAVLFVLNILLDKADFGYFAMAQVIIQMVGLIAVAFFQTLVMYHGAHFTDHEADHTRSFVANMVTSSFWLGVFLSIVIIVFSCLGRSAFNNDYLMNLMILMAGAVPFMMALGVIGIWHRARQDLTPFLVHNELMPHMLRLVLFCVLIHTGVSILLLAAIYIVSYAVPLLWMLLHSDLNLKAFPTHMNREDISYGSKALLTQAISRPSRGLDLVIVGALAGGVGAADYTMAMRISQLLLMPKQALAQLLVPRLRKSYKIKNYGQLLKEYKAVQYVSTGVVLVLLAGLMVFGPYILKLFGDYASAFPLLMILAGASLIRTAYGSTGDLLVMTGHTGWNLIAATASLALLLVGCVLLVPVIGVQGAAIANAMSAWLYMAGAAIILWKQEALMTQSWVMHVIMIGALGGISYIMWGF